MKAIDRAIMTHRANPSEETNTAILAAMGSYNEERLARHANALVAKNMTPRRSDH